MSQLEIDYMEYATNVLAQDAYVTSDTTPLQSYSEDTIKTQGSYALKLEATTAALNETVTKTLTGEDILDLTGKDAIKLDARSTGTGSNLQVSIAEAANENSGNLFIEAETDITDKNGTHIITVGGNAALSSAQHSPYNNSNASVYLDGVGDYLSIPSHSDFDLRTYTTSWTIDFWVYMVDDDSPRLMVIGADGDTNNIGIYKVGSVLYFAIANAAANGWAFTIQSTLSEDVLVHIALVNNAGVVTAYKDGVSVGTDTLTEDIGLGSDYKLTWGIAAYDFSSNPLTGYIDNARVVKGTALWTTGFNLTDAELFYSKYSTHTINIASADTYQEEEWDISGIADADKDAIDQIQFKVLNAGSVRDYYIDNIIIPIDYSPAFYQQKRVSHTNIRR